MSYLQFIYEHWFLTLLFIGGGRLYVQAFFTGLIKGFAEAANEKKIK